MKELEIYLKPLIDKNAQLVTKAMYFLAKTAQI